MRFVRLERRRPVDGVYPLLVVGSPRSGTRFMASVLRKSGFLVGHERLFSAGTVSSYFTVDDYYYQGPHGASQRRSRCRFSQVWHQTRNPIHVISSLHNRIRISWWHWQEKHTGVSYDEEDAAAKFWLAWTDIADADPAVSFVYKAEDIPDLWPEIMDRLGRKAEFPDQIKPEHSRTRNGYDMVSLDDMNPAVAEAVVKKAVKYGYNL